MIQVEKEERVTCNYGAERAVEDEVLIGVGLPRRSGRKRVSLACSHLISRGVQQLNTPTYSWGGSVAWSLTKTDIAGL